MGCKKKCYTWLPGYHKINNFGARGRFLRSVFLFLKTPQTKNIETKKFKILHLPQTKVNARKIEILYVFNHN